MGITRYKIDSGNADASGDATATTSQPINGIIRAIELVYAASSAAGTDVVITEDGMSTDQTILSLTDANTSGWFFPHNYAEDTSGNDLTYDGSNQIAVPFFVAQTLTITVAQQTEGKNVVAHVYVERR